MEAAEGAKKIKKGREKQKATEETRLSSEPDEPSRAAMRVDLGFCAVLDIKLSQDTTDSLKSCYFNANNSY